MLKGTSYCLKEPWWWVVRIACMVGRVEKKAGKRSRFKERSRWKESFSLFAHLLPCALREINEFIQMCKKLCQWQIFPHVSSLVSCQLFALWDFFFFCQHGLGFYGLCLWCTAWAMQTLWSQRRGNWTLLSLRQKRVGTQRWRSGKCLPFCRKALGVLFQGTEMDSSESCITKAQEIT